MSNLQQLKSRHLKILGISNIPLWGMGHRGGMPSVYWGQKGFVQAGHEVHLLVPGEKGHKEIVEDGIHVHYFTIPLKPFSSKHIWLHRFSVKLYWCLFLFLAARAAMDIGKTVKPDVVYGHTSYGAPVAWFVAKIYGIQNITRLYGTFLFPILSNPLRLIGKCEEVLAFKIPSSFLIVTDDGTGGMVVAERLKVPAEKVKCWRNGVNRFYDPNFDTEAFKKSVHLSSDQRLVLTASRLAEWKRVDRLINAVPKVVSELDDVVFVILGDGTDRERLERLAESLGVARHVRFMGDVSQDEVAKYMNAADVFVSLFDLSNISNAVQEAMACGKCVLVLNSGDTSNLVKHKETGVLVDLKDLPQLPAILKDLLQDSDLRKRLGSEAMHFADEHMPSWEARVQKEVELVEKLVEKSKETVLTRGEKHRSFIG